MKKARKLLVALLVLTFVFSTFNVGFAAEEDEELPFYVVRALALGYLKGFEDGELKLDQQITRAQALAFIIRISGLEKSAELMKGQTIFPDVNSDPSLQWATGYINLGVGQGIIKGYPDGTFKGNDPVTFAEMAKMLLYAMNYGVTVEGAQWPAGVMGKADDLGIFDDVNALPNVPALRGDVVKMIDNSLDIKHLVQEGYGAVQTYKEGTKTFLTKMGIKEIEGNIVSFDDEENKVVIDVVKVDGEDKVENGKEYGYLEGVSFVGLKGVKVVVWVLNDKDVVYVSAKDTVVYDFVDIEDDGDKLLKNQDKVFTFSGKTVAKGDFVKAAIDGKKANVIENYGGLTEAGLIKSINSNSIEYIQGDATKRIRNLDDKDILVIINGQVSSYDKLAKGMYFAFTSAPDAKDKDVEFDYVIAATDKTVEGELDRVKMDGGKIAEVRIDGKYYDVASTLYASTDEGENYKVVTDLDDFFNEEVFAVLNLVGEVVYIKGDVEEDTTSFYGFVIEIDKFNDKIKVRKEVDGEAKNVTYDVDTDDVDLDSLTKGQTVNALYKITVNEDGEVNKVSTISWAKSNSNAAKFDEDGNYIEVADGTRIYADAAVIFGIDTSDSKKIEISLLEWNDIKATQIPSGKSVKVYADDVEADIIVLVHDGVEFKKSTDYKVAFVTDKNKISKDKYEYTIVTGEGEDTIVSEDDVDVEKIILYTVDDDNEADIVASYAYNKVDGISAKASDWEGKVGLKASKDGAAKYLYADITYRVASDVVVYLIDSDGDYIQKDMTDILAGDSVWFLLYKGNVQFVFYKVAAAE